jgi:methionine sulfoxide reductase heme-binding subunit
MTIAQTSGVPVAWLVARAAGLVAFTLLSVSVTLGLALSTKLLGNRRGKMLLGWHQTLMWTALAMVALHMGALALDPTLHFGLIGVLVPGAAPWRPLPVAAGIVSAWLVLVLAASFHFRRRIGQRRWRLLHYATFGAFAIGLYHALNVGSDVTGIRGLVFAGIFAAPVVWLTYARILMPRAKAQPAASARPPLHATATIAEQPERSDRAAVSA